MLFGKDDFPREALYERIGVELVIADLIDVVGARSIALCQNYHLVLYKLLFGNPQQ
jgi:hypothetical protein